MRLPAPKIFPEPVNWLGISHIPKVRYLIIMTGSTLLMNRQCKDLKVDYLTVLPDGGYSSAQAVAQCEWDYVETALSNAA